MVLVDTTVWVAHLRDRNAVLADLLSDGLILMHSFIVGELACGNLKDRAGIISDLIALPAARRAADSDVLQLLEQRKLWGRGLGWVDVHLLASALLSHCRFWTLDKKLGRVASELGLS